MRYDPQAALQLLRQGTQNPHATFREGQEEAIAQLIEGNGRLLVIQKTGWGKSFVYFIAAQLLRQAGLGPTLLISPLLALMRNQIAAAERMGLRAVTINSSNKLEWDRVENELAADAVDLLLISPERLANAEFMQSVFAPIAATIGLLVVDEAHCISDWGHDFRPDYRRLEQIIRHLPPNLRLLATTATANHRVTADLMSVLGANLTLSRGDLHRPSLTLQTIPLTQTAERLAWLAEQIPTLSGSGLIYTLTTGDADQIAEWLNQRGIVAASYHGGIEAGERLEREEALMSNQLKVLVATSALGMGYDKPDIAFVIHEQIPGSVVAYYQQVGRAGRALESAYAILLSDGRDQRINDWFIDSAFPSREEVAQVLAALETVEHGLTLQEFLPRINLRQSPIEKALKLLSLESPAPVVKEGKYWQLTAAPLSELFWQRVERITALRREEQRQMQRYTALPLGAQMPFLIRALDGEAPDSIPPRLPLLPTTVQPTTQAAAQQFLQQRPVRLEPRKQWPRGVAGYSGNIAPHQQAETGWALSRWGDGGWSEQVRAGKYRHHRFEDALVTACVKLLKQEQPQPAPQWVTAIPSLRHPELVPDFAQRLAAALGLPFVPILLKTEDRPEQKQMANSAQQLRNVAGSLALAHPQAPAGAVLLVDDMVDSRWSFTVAAALLRQAGSGPVWPLALAHTGSKGGA